MSWVDGTVMKNLERFCIYRDGHGEDENQYHDLVGWRTSTFFEKDGNSSVRSEFAKLFLMV